MYKNDHERFQSFDECYESSDHERFESFDEYYESFEKLYHCSVSKHETGDKIIMPQSALNRLACTEIDYPMLFELSALSSDGRVTHCGVLEFTAEEGYVYLPEWMMENMKLEDYEIVRVKNVTLPKGTFMKLQPHSKDFLELPNPKAFLETTLRHFSCVSTGDTIMIMHENDKFYIDMVETKPYSAISVFETDCEVDFAPPLDYVEEPVKTDSVCDNVQEEEEHVGFKAFTGKARRLDGKCEEVKLNAANGGKGSKKEEKRLQQQAPEEEFRAFTGKSRRLDACDWDGNSSSLEEEVEKLNLNNDCCWNSLSCKQVGKAAPKDEEATPEKGEMLLKKRRKMKKQHWKKKRSNHSSQGEVTAYQAKFSASNLLL